MSGNGANSTKTSVLLGTFRSVKLEHLVAGLSGGVVSTLVLHPLDLLKIRFAVDDGRVSTRPTYNGLGHAFKSICKQEGVRGLYKGVTPNIAGAGTSWGFYFLFYNTVKTEMQGGNSKIQLSPTMHMLAAAEAGILTLAMTNPIWVVKTRLCLQYENDKSKMSGNDKGYKGMMDALVRIFKEEGVRGLYRGFVPGMWGVSHGAIQFMTYEQLKNAYNQHMQQPIDTKLGTGEYLFFGAFSKLVASLITYPCQLVRARLQDKNSVYSGAMDCVGQTFRYEGLRGLYKGMSPYLVHVVPNICIVLLIYEKLTTVS